MIDWVTILLALVIIAALVGGFGFVAWKINMSDPLTSADLTGKKDDGSQLFDSVGDRKRKDKTANDQKKKKRTVQKKTKRDDEAQHVVKFVEPSGQTSEETDNEREESEQESSAAATSSVVEASSKARKRKNKARAGATSQPSGPIEGILHNKDEKSPVVERAQPLPHLKSGSNVPKDEVELARQHQQSKAQAKASQPVQKPAAAAPAATTKKPPSVNGNPAAQKQAQPARQEQQEQPFTTVVGKGHKGPATPAQPPQQPSQPPQQQQQQQPAKPAAAQPAAATSAPIPPPPASASQQAPTPVLHEKLAQRQPVRQQKEPAPQLNGHGSNSVSAKPPTAASASASPTKLADLVKALPTSQVVVTELMSALDARPLSADELNIIMQKIANKQFLIKRDWSKLQYGQKVDPQAHIGQVLDESARAYEEDMKTNAGKRLKELNDELITEKRRINDLLTEANEKDMSIQLLRTQLSSLQHPQQQHFQSYEAEYRRLGEENMQLKQRLAQQQQHFQQHQQHQQQLSSMSLMNNNSEGMSVQARVVEEQIKKLSIENGKLEKQAQTRESAIKEMQKEKETLIRTNQQLTQKAQEGQKQFQQNEEKLLKELNESRNLHLNQLNECKRRIEELETKNEQLHRVEPVRAEPPVLNNEERDKFEKEINQLKQQLTHETEQHKKQLADVQTQQQSKETELHQQLEQLKNNAQQRQHEESLTKELADKAAQVEALQAELQDAKARNDASHSQLDERLRADQDKQKQILSGLLDEGVRSQLPKDAQDFSQWLASYQQIFASSNDNSQRSLRNEAEKLKRENDQLHKNMNDVENQLKDIEQTVQSKEETLLAELQSKDAIVESIQNENEQLTGEMQRLRAEVERLQQAHNVAQQEGQAFKRQLDERSLLSEHSSSSNATLNAHAEEAAASSTTSTAEQPAFAS